MHFEDMLGKQVTFEGDDGRTYQGEYLGIVQPYEYRHHAIHVQGNRDANWVRVGSERELSIKPVTYPERQALDEIAEAWNNSSSATKDIMAAVGKALKSAGYELKF